MKKILCLVAVAALGLAACSKNTKTNGSASAYGSTGRNGQYTADARSAKDAKYQIIDQEFDNMLAPETDYDAVPAYELQACGDSYLPLVEPNCCGKGQTKAAAKGQARAKATAQSVATTRAKKVTNTTNIYYVDGGQTVPVSSTTTTKTVYKNGAVASTNTTSSNQQTRTVQNADGSVTTTTTYAN